MSFRRYSGHWPWSGSMTPSVYMSMQNFSRGASLARRNPEQSHRRISVDRKFRNL